MQRLHLVGFTSEVDGLIFSVRRGAKSGGYVVALDEQLLASIREAARLQSGEDGASADGDGGRRGRMAAVDSGLTPKEIQSRLRSGRTVAEVAEEAGTTEEWIRRFASPVLAEQTRIVGRAIVVRCRANRKGESAEPLAESVVLNLIERGLSFTDDEVGAGWSAYHVRDSSWVVRFQFQTPRTLLVARWGYDGVDGTVVPLNRLGTELGFVEAGRRRRKPFPVSAADDHRSGQGGDGGGEGTEEQPSPGPLRRRATRKAGGRRATAGRKAPRQAVSARKAGAVKKVSAVKKAGAVKKAAGKKAAGKKAAVKKAAAAKATSRKKAGLRKAVATTPTASRTKAAARKTPARKVTAPRARVRKASARTRPATRVASRRSPTVTTITNPPPSRMPPVGSLTRPSPTAGPAASGRLAATTINAAGSPPRRGPSFGADQSSSDGLAPRVTRRTTTPPRPAPALRPASPPPPARAAEKPPLSVAARPAVPVARPVTAALPVEPPSTSPMRRPRPLVAVRRGDDKTPPPLRTRVIRSSRRSASGRTSNDTDSGLAPTEVGGSTRRLVIQADRAGQGPAES